MKIPRILLTAGASGSGKTLITCGILKALTNRGQKSASFKCGPDYIDPMFHSRVIGTKSRNLDTFFTGESVTRHLLIENSRDCDIAVMEGVMGYYDGVGGTTTRASAYDLACITRTPAILIVNSKGMSVSLCAYVKGFLEYRTDSQIRGVIFNQMSPMLYPRMKGLVEKECGVRVLGYVPRVDDCVIESRHLGLVLPGEIPKLREKLDRLALILEKSLDMEGILALAQSAEELEEEDLLAQHPDFSFRLDRPVRLAVARDDAFCFIYEDNLRLLEEMGAQMVPFSPVRDAHLPEQIQGVLLFGGYPELYGKALERNAALRRELSEALRNGLPCIAECGGFMYLHEFMEDMDKELCQGVGVIPGKAFRTPRLQRFGYITLRQRTSVWGEETLGEIPAHEFHYFDSENCGESFFAEKPESGRGWRCIHGTESLCAGFPHIHYYGNPAFARAFLQKCAAYERREP
ncbi:MAG: cobyrinate a,c-diamide synthase [Eubacteriales bacterium]|nr:cobyrinate a,c-diamide synthase [Eubacteriales bacterium]